jgi:hypothetical protein
LDSADWTAAPGLAQRSPAIFERSFLTPGVRGSRRLAKPDVAPLLAAIDEDPTGNLRG